MLFSLWFCRGYNYEGTSCVVVQKRWMELEGKNYILPLERDSERDTHCSLQNCSLS